MKIQGFVLVEALVAIILLAGFIMVYSVSNHNLIQFERTLSERAKAVFSEQRLLIIAKTVPLSQLRQMPEMNVIQHSQHEYSITLTNAFRGRKLSVSRLE